MKLIKLDNVPAIPIEDLKDGDVIHCSQLTEPSIKEVYDLALLGLSIKGIAAYFRSSLQEFNFHFPKTIAQARADKAARLLAHAEMKAYDDKIPGDFAALKFLANRLDPEPKETTVFALQQNFITDKITTDEDIVGDLRSARKTTYNTIKVDE